MSLKRLTLIIIALFSLSACQSKVNPEPNEVELPASPISSESLGDESDIREITVNARRFEFSPSIIKAKKGEKVKIKINNIDTLHNIQIPELNEFSNTEEFILDTSKSGEFDYFCSNICGLGHGDMKGKIIIE